LRGGFVRGYEDAHVLVYMEDLEFLVSMTCWNSLWIEMVERMGDRPLCTCIGQGLGRFGFAVRIYQANSQTLIFSTNILVILFGLVLYNELHD
jgi:hypothetical protein